MKKYSFLIIMLLLFVFFISGNIFATETLKPIGTVLISDFDFPYLNEKIDRTATVDGECIISNIYWYKDGKKVFEDVFMEEGEYICKIYFQPNSGYTFTDSSYLLFAYAQDIIGSKHGQDYAGHFLEVIYAVKAKETEYPTSIAFNNIAQPKCNEKLDYELTIGDTNYYNYKKIEWYHNGKLLSKDELAEEGEYLCRIYLDLYNGFEYNIGIEAYMDSTRIPIIQGVNGLYIENTYTSLKSIDDKVIKNMFLDFNKLPTYGGAVKDIFAYEAYESPYFEIDSIEWFCKGYRMLDDYFYEGDYTCRVYFNFINGGYPGSDFQLFLNNYFSGTEYAMINNRYYAEKTFKVQKQEEFIFKFDDLNIPIYGGVQDTKVTSLEPGLYTPGMVYWYKDGKYMSNIDLFSEGTHKCKFVLTLNPQVVIPSELKATINGEEANAYIGNNVVTIEKSYEVKKPTTPWTAASNWAVPELNDALNNALIPSTLNNKNYTQNITRAEFAAVAVKMYERLALKVTAPAAKNPFTDTNDVEILKAYALGITNGTSATTFSPNNLITRQEMATMMVRALEKANISTNVNLNNVKKFADHAKIDNWALNGVYFMSNIGIIKGKGNNTFDVLGNATREEALAISIRSVNYYK